VSVRVVVSGSGAICAAGKSPGEIWDAVWTGRPAIRPIEQWDTAGWPTSLAGEIP
jgi:3-oxoacyl-(acyl-carrier-protein) synthase